MAFALRRVFSSTTLVSLRNSSHRSRHLSYICSSNPFNSVAQTPAVFGTNGASNHLGFEFLNQSRRGFAKGKNSKDDGGNTVEIVPEIGPTVNASTVSLMEAAVVALSQELSKLRTGRASPGMLDHIIVETGGMKMPLSRIAVVSVMDSKTLSVTPYDPNSLKEIESAIVSSPLGLNPQVDGQRLIAAIPPLTKEHMQAICKVVTKSAEDVKQSIRRARQKAFDTIKRHQESLKKAKLDEQKRQEKESQKKVKLGVCKDDQKRLEKEIDELTKKYIKSAEDMCKAKEKEITST